MRIQFTKLMRILADPDSQHCDQQGFVLYIQIQGFDLYPSFYFS
jgi:hypothetical protein